MIRVGGSDDENRLQGAMNRTAKKEKGAYYTPDPVVRTLLDWAIRDETERLLDPSCGDGRFLAGHRNSVGIEWDPASAETAMARAPWALIHDGDFFTWAAETSERFHCAVGNPPFIRYQRFKGEIRARALQLCARLGAPFSGLTSSWAPFLVATASLLLPGGRMAFVVPAEIGHAPYSAPLLEYLVTKFARVQVTAVRSKLFQDLSEDCWLLYAEGFGGKTDEIRFSTLDHFRVMQTPPRQFLAVSVREWRTEWRRRLRPFLLPLAARDLYRTIARNRTSRRFGDWAQIGIGYVTGANDFFHLRASQADALRIPDGVLYPTVRNSRALPLRSLSREMVEGWRRQDDPILLLRLSRNGGLSAPIRRYLDSDAGRLARQAYKCRVREPWYVVPDVQVPDFFLSYMSGTQPSLVRNDARCSCTNSVHGVRLKPGVSGRQVEARWDHPFVRLSCEIEGHPLGGGMLKLEPREASQVILPGPRGLQEAGDQMIGEALSVMRSWRHYAPE